MVLKNQNNLQGKHVGNPSPKTSLAATKLLVIYAMVLSNVFVICLSLVPNVDVLFLITLKLSKLPI